VRHTSSIIVRGLDDSVKQQLVAQAKRHGRSMEAEVRDILTKAARRPNIGVALMRAVQDVGGVDDLPVPQRDDDARAVDFE
jgi:plasmid stability protein